MPGEGVRSEVLYKKPSFEVGQGAVRLRVIQTGPIENLVELRVDYEKADVPSRAYYADYCDVVKGRSGISLFFGKLKSGTSVLRNKVEIVFPEELFIRQLWKNATSLLEKAKEEFERRPLEPIQELVDTEIVQTFRSNNVMLIFASDEALMDFYYIAPTEIHYAFTKKRADISLDPVIRIVLSTSLLFELLTKCKQILERIPNFERIMEGR